MNEDVDTIIMKTILQIQKVTKKFGGLTALSGVSFNTAQSEILGIIGPNGSGKTTLLNVISGLIKPNSGEIYFKGRRITGMRTHTISKMGIGRTFQIINLFMGMSVVENIFIGQLRPQKDKIDKD